VQTVEVRHAARRPELIVYVFDLLRRDGCDQRALPLLERTDLPCLRLAAAFDGVQLLHAVERHRLEGILWKRKDSPYPSGESRDWRKTKTAG
jgi:ATP-dependent DNA ligase